MLRCALSRFRAQKGTWFPNQRVISGTLLNTNRILQGQLSSKATSCYYENRESQLLSLAMVAGAVTFLNYIFDDPSYTLLDSPQNSSFPVETGKEDGGETTTVVNWSGTHSIEVLNKNYFEPETVQELEQLIAKCHREGQPVRPVGSALSPNAIAFQEGGMVSLANLDRIIKVDKEDMTVTVEAGARVSQVIDALRSHGLTLPNLASIAEQQIGGFTQIGAHGTGARIAPVDDFVTRLKLVTPARGTVELSEKDGEIFQLAKVGLGCLGVVSEVTMKVVPAHNLLEHTFVLTRSEAKEKLRNLLKKHKHVRYMWIPYQDAVVVVTNDEEDENSKMLVEMSAKNKGGLDSFKPLRDLLIQLSKDTQEPLTDESLAGRGFGELRDALLAFKPLSGDHIKIVNKAEAEFWKLSQGYQLRPSDELLQFDCGGQQWVFEVCIPTGTYDDNAGHDIQFMDNLLERIETEMIPAHAPIEQRWSANSKSLMSPAHGPDGALYCWVGIILYLPTDDEKERKDITDTFKGQYCDLARDVGIPFSAVSHWGKLEMPTTGDQFLKLRQLLTSRYPVEKFNAARLYYDPKNILGNDLLNVVLGNPK